MEAAGADYQREEGHSSPSPRISTIPSTSTTLTQVLEAATLNIPKLKEQNYTQWKAVITHSIKSAKLWEYIDGSIEEPSGQNTTELMKYMREAGAVRNAILGSLESGAQRYIEEALTPRDAWLALENQYLTAGHDTHSIAIEQQLADLKLEEGGDVAEHIANFCRLRRHLNGTRFALDDRASTSMLYRSLTTDYRRRISTQEHTDTEDFNAFCTRLEAYYRSVTGSDANISALTDSEINPAEDPLAWRVPEDLEAFGLTGSKNPLLEERAAMTCRDCLLKGHGAGTPECPQYEWRRELWGDLREDTRQLTNESEGVNTQTPSDQATSGARRGNKRFTYEFSEPVRVALSFKELELKEQLIQDLGRSKLRVPHGIQQCAILPAINGRNIIAQAPHETGKTTAVVIAIAQMIDIGKRGIQALIVTPTTDKIVDIQSIFTSLDHRYRCYGSTSGQSFEGGLDQLAEGHGRSIFIGTPDHIIQLYRRGILCTSGVKVLVLDDLDMLMDNGFDRHISDVYLSLPYSVQTLGIGTTLSPETLREVDRYIRSPLYITVDQDNRILQAITHYFAVIPKQFQHSKLYTLTRLLKNPKLQYKIGVLCDTFTEVRSIQSSLGDGEYYNYYVTGENHTSKQNQDIIEIFRTGQRRYLLTTTTTPLKQTLEEWNTDLCIANYGIPSSPQNYIERISYIGICSGKNIAITLVDEDTGEIDMIREIERQLGIQMVELKWNANNLY